MKIIIDIPEKVVTAIQNGEDYRYDIHTAIAQGRHYEGRPEGKWIIDVEDGINTMVTCPFCKERHCCVMNYCGNCGAKMEVPDETDN